MALASVARTLPWDWYSDAAALELERERIFAGSWQYACRADQVVTPGSFVAVTAGLTPVVVVRGRDGELRAFVNICRHRGSLLCEGEGRRETIQCPYHAWTYDLDGSLRNAPRADREPGFDRSDLSLVSASVGAWGPFVFVNLDAEAAPLDAWLGDVPRMLAEGGVDLDGLTFHSHVEGWYEANWKVCAENFLECYHCSVAHPSFSKAIDVAPDVYGLEVHGAVATQWGPPRDGGGGVYDADGDVVRGQFHFLFPNTVINVMPGRANLSVGPMIPVGPDRTYRTNEYYFARDEDPAWIADYLALDTVVGDEDRVLVERVQQGMRARVLDSGRLMPESEKLIAHFQSLVADALGSDG